MTSRIETVTLPTYLASALINGDTSGLGENDVEALYAAQKIAADFGGSYVSMSDEEWFSWFNDLPDHLGRVGGDVAEFSILIFDPETEE